MQPFEMNIHFGDAAEWFGINREGVPVIDLNLVDSAREGVVPTAEATRLFLNAGKEEPAASAQALG